MPYTPRKHTPLHHRHAPYRAPQSVRQDLVKSCANIARSYSTEETRFAYCQRMITTHALTSTELQELRKQAGLPYTPYSIPKDNVPKKRPTTSPRPTPKTPRPKRTIRHTQYTSRPCEDFAPPRLTKSNKSRGAEHTPRYPTLRDIQAISEKEALKKSSSPLKSTNHPITPSPKKQNKIRYLLWFATL